MLDEEQEHREEDEQEHDLLHARHRGVAVDPLGNLDELYGEDEREHPAADGQDSDLPDAVGYVVHRDAPRGGEHGVEVGTEDAVVADSLEHLYLLREHPVGGVPQEVGEPAVDVVGDVGIGALRRYEDEGEKRDGQREGLSEAAVARDSQKRSHGHHIASSSPVRPSMVTVTMVAFGSLKVNVELVDSLLASM